MNSKVVLSVLVGLVIGFGACLLLVFEDLPYVRADSQETCCKGDTNGDGRLDISDAVYLLNYLFQGGPEPIRACGIGDFCIPYGTLDEDDLNLLAAAIHQGASSIRWDITYDNQVTLFDYLALYYVYAHAGPPAAVPTGEGFKSWLGLVALDPQEAWDTVPGGTEEEKEDNLQKALERIYRSWGWWLG